MGRLGHTSHFTCVLRVSCVDFYPHQFAICHTATLSVYISFQLSSTQLVVMSFFYLCVNECCGLQRPVGYYVAVALRHPRRPRRVPRALRSIEALIEARSGLWTGHHSLGGNRELVLLGTPAVRSDVRRPTLQPRDLGRTGLGS